MADNPMTDPFAQVKADFAAFEKQLQAAPAQAAAPVTTAASGAEKVILDTAEGLKAEFILLEARFKAALGALDDRVTKGAINPVFAQVAKLVSHVAAIAKSL